MNNVLLWVGGLLVAVLALVFAMPYAIDWNSYRGVFEEEASRVLGRDVRVGGRVDLRLLPKPFVRFEKVRIGDVGAMQGEPFFRADSFTLWLSVPPLLRGAIEANDVELERPVLSLAVDEQGVGNWRSLQISPGTLPFVPSDVALQAVRIHDGTVMFRDVASRSNVALTGIDGEFAASALAGPYRFRGDVVVNGERHELRLGTSTQEADGKLRLKLSVRAAGSQNSYALDGALSELAARPRLDGTLTAKLPLSPVAIGGAGRVGGGSGVVFELQAQLAADAKGAKLSELTLGFEQDGRPQMLTGDMAASWGGGRSTTVELSSRWLDLDRIAGVGERPLEAVRDLAGRLAALMPVGGTSRASIGVEQVNLGGEAVSTVVMTLVRREGELELEELSGLVPGNGRLAVQGRFGAVQGKAVAPFNGSLMLRGASLRRFLAWAMPGQATVAGAKSEVPFSLAGGLLLADERVAITNASLELPGSRLTGSVEQRTGDMPELAVAVEGDTIDLSVLVPEVVRLDAWRRVLGGEAPAGAGPAGPLEQKARAGLLRLDVRAGRLTDGASTLHDVMADIRAGRGRIDIPVLRLRSAEGLAIDATAALDTVNGRRQGTITGWAAAPTAEAARQLANQLASLLPASTLAMPAEGLAQLAPLDVGFTATLAKAPAARLTVKADGSAAGSRITGIAVLDGGFADWRTAPVEISASIDSPDIAGFAARLRGRAAGGGAAEAARAPGTAMLKLAGPSAEAIAALIEIDSAALTASFQGRARVPDGEGGADVQGDLRLAAKDLAAALDIVQLPLRIRPKGLSAEGVVGVVRTGNVVRLAPRQLDIGGARIAGDVSLTTDGDTTRVGGRLAMARGSVQDLIGAVLGSRARPGADAGGLASLWSDAAFDFSGLEGIDGRLGLAFASLEVADGLVLADANLDVELAPGKIAVPRLEGRALDGPFRGRLVLERAAAGAALTLAGRLGPVPLAVAMGPVAGTPAAGSATLEFEVQGRAASLRGLASALAGTGAATLSDARIPGLTPVAIDKVADSLLDGTAAPSRLDLIAAVRRALAGMALGAGGRRIALEVSEGAARLARLDIAVEGGRASNATTVDLLTLRADSEWTLTSTRRKGAVGGELPSVSVVYVGPLKEVLQAEPKVSVEALERELTVRRMERDVERLEMLRRQDEDRARKERQQRGGASGTGPGGSDSAPVIEVPLPIPGQKAGTAPRPAAGPVNRPPGTEARPRSLEDILQAQ